MEYGVLNFVSASINDYSLFIQQSVSDQNELAIRCIIEKAVKTVFGEWGAGALHVDVLRAREKHALLRVEAQQLRKLRAALTLATELRVQAQAPTLQALV